MKESYENYKADEIVLLNNSGVYSDQHIDAGTEIKIASFHVKKGRYSSDLNKKGINRKFVMRGYTVKSNILVYSMLFNIVKKD